jgi:hypothetical protein
VGGLGILVYIVLEEAMYVNSLDDWLTSSENVARRYALSPTHFVPNLRQSELRWFFLLLLCVFDASSATIASTAIIQSCDLLPRISWSHS